MTSKLPRMLTIAVNTHFAVITNIFSVNDGIINGSQSVVSNIYNPFKNTMQHCQLAYAFNLKRKKKQRDMRKEHTNEYKCLYIPQKLHIHGHLFLLLRDTTL